MQTKNSYQYPLTITSQIRITYDSSPAHKGRLKHAADFICPEGTPIKAALDGIVVDVKRDSNIGGPTEDFDQLGNYIEIKHTEGEYSIYEHIRKDGVNVKVGDRVRTGQVIGYSGKTGWIAHLGPHVHFDVHKYIGKDKEDYESVKIRWAN